MLHPLIVSFFCINIVASPVTQFADEQQYDELSWNPDSNDNINSEDTIIANCASESSSTPDSTTDSSSNENILRRESASCSAYRSDHKPKYKMLPLETGPLMNRELLQKELERKCPFKAHPLFLYCAGPEITDDSTNVLLSDQSIESTLVYKLIMDCTKGQHWIVIMIHH